MLLIDIWILILASFAGMILVDMQAEMRMSVTWKLILLAYKGKREEGKLSAPFTREDPFFV